MGLTVLGMTWWECEGPSVRRARAEQAPSRLRLPTRWSSKLNLTKATHWANATGEPDPKTLRYEAESPDEAALVVAAKVAGFFFFRRSNTSMMVRERTRGEDGSVVEQEVGGLAMRVRRWAGSVW